MIQSSLRALRRMATFRRTMNLLRAFPEEQKHPEVFYSLLAKDTAQFIAAASIDVRGVGLAGQKILDVGGGPGYFAQAFDSYGAWYVPVEPDAGEMSAA
ncbi:MAG: SAM-dependent methyltransferase, partial [Corynebacterium sp.]|nr:SAM-dependent methyltransferase [Corynebacterium sp.]